MMPDPVMDRQADGRIMQIVGRIGDEAGPAAVGIVFPYGGRTATAVLSLAEAYSFAAKMVEMVKSLELITNGVMTAETAQSLLTCNLTGRGH